MSDEDFEAGRALFLFRTPQAPPELFDRMPQEFQTAYINKALEDDQ